MDDLSYAIDMFQKSDVQLDDYVYIYEDDSVLDNDDSDCTST